MSGEVTVAQPAGVRLTGVACDSNKAVLGETLTWTAQTTGAAGEVAYSFAMYRDYALMGLYETGSSPEFSFAPGEAGTYSVVAYARDDVRSASASSADVRVVSSGLFVDSVTADQITGAVGVPITWTVHASGSEQLQYMYFVYFIDELVYSSPVTTENTFTYTPTEAFGLHPYVLKGMVSDGEQTESFESPGLLVTDEGRARIISITPDRTFALPGEKITWTVTIDYGTVTGGSLGQLMYILFDSGSECVDQTEWVQDTAYSFTPTQSGDYYLRAYLDTGGWGFEAVAPVVRVGTPVLGDFDVAIDLDQRPDITLPDMTTKTPAPTQLIPEIVVPQHADFSGVLATTRPPMAPEKPKPTPTPAPTLIPDLPIFEPPSIHLP
jgi:hypothetical protein